MTERERRKKRCTNANRKQMSGKDTINISMISRKLILITETIFLAREKIGLTSSQNAKRQGEKREEVFEHKFMA